MKIITIPFADFAALDGELTREQWREFYRQHGIEPSKVKRSYTTEDQKSTVYEVEE